MSDNQHNIDEIQAYLSGKLDAKAMHRLEREAQDDPFLMDAIEGYQAAGTDQSANFEAIKERFVQRTETKKERSLILWRVLPIAATLLIVLGIGFLWLSPKKEQEQVVVSPAVEKTINPVVSIVHDSVVANSIPQLIAQARRKKPEIRKQATATSVIIASNSNKISKHDSAGRARNNVITSIDYNSGRVSQPNQVPEIGELANNINKPIRVPTDIKGVMSSYRISGKVTDATGHALAGVKVGEVGAAHTVLTDTNGVFHYYTLHDDGKLSIAYSGYNKKQINFTNKDSLSVVLNESTNELAQVSVPGYAEDSLGTGIHPLAGWKAFTSYIKKNAFMPNGETGRVKLAFTVNAHGSITGIRIIRGKSDAMNQKAIALLINGPQWMGSNEGKELKLKIRFRKMKTT